MNSQATLDKLQLSVFSQDAPKAPAVACNLNAFDARQTARYNALLTTLSLFIVGVRELEHGYEIAFPPDPATASSVTEFASLERLCCPFLTFTIQMEPADLLRLRLTGPSGAKQILSEFAWISAKLPAMR